MTGETVVYKNDLNLVPLRDFTSTEINLFFSMCNKLKERNTEELKIPFDELKHLSSYEQTEKKRFINDLKRIYDKVLKLTYTEYSGLSFKKFVLFTAYEVNADEDYLTISVNPKLKHILNELTGDFTKFELEELTHIKSTYSKNMYRLLKQFKHTGYFKIHMNDFRERLDVPESYRMTNINTSILKPIIKDLSPLFKDLRINKVRGKKGRQIEWLEFVFRPEYRIYSKKQLQREPKEKEAIKSREKTPEWLKHRDKPITKDQNDPQLERDRQAFLKQLKTEWEDE